MFYRGNFMDMLLLILLGVFRGIFFQSIASIFLRHLFLHYRNYLCWSRLLILRSLQLYCLSESINIPICFQCLIYSLTVLKLNSQGSQFTNIQNNNISQEKIYCLIYIFVSNFCTISFFFVHL